MENFRRIAGGTDKSASAGVDLAPSSSTAVGLTLNYDDVHYNTKYQNNQDLSGLGATVSLQQLITHRLKMKVDASQREMAKDYGAELDYLVHTRPGTKLQVGLLGARNLGTDKLASDDRVGFNVSYSWGGNTSAKNTGYQAMADNHTTVDAHQGLSTWTGTPAVHMSQVLAIADQKTINKATGKTMLGDNNGAVTPKAVTVNAESFNDGQKGVAQDIGYKLSDLFSYEDSANPKVQASFGIDTGTAAAPHTAIYDSTGKVVSTGLAIGIDAKTGQVEVTGTPTTVGTFTAVIYAKTMLGTSYVAPSAGKFPGAITFTINVENGAPHFDPKKESSQGNVTAPSANAITVDSTWGGFELGGTNAYVLGNDDKPDTHFALSIVPGGKYSQDFALAKDKTEITTSTVGTSAFKGLTSVSLQVKACDTTNTSACSAPETITIPVNAAPTPKFNPAKESSAGNITAPAANTIMVGPSWSGFELGGKSGYVTDSAGNPDTNFVLNIVPDSSYSKDFAVGADKTELTSSSTSAFTGLKSVSLKVEACDADHTSDCSAPESITIPVSAAPTPTWKTTTITGPTATVGNTFTLPLKPDISDPVTTGDDALTVKPVDSSKWGGLGLTIDSSNTVGGTPNTQLLQEATDGVLSLQAVVSNKYGTSPSGNTATINIPVAPSFTSGISGLNVENTYGGTTPLSINLSSVIANATAPAFQAGHLVIVPANASAAALFTSYGLKASAQTITGTLTAAADAAAQADKNHQISLPVIVQYQNSKGTVISQSAPANIAVTVDESPTVQNAPPASSYDGPEPASTLDLSKVFNPGVVKGAPATLTYKVTATVKNGDAKTDLLKDFVMDSSNPSQLDIPAIPLGYSGEYTVTITASNNAPGSKPATTSWTLQAYQSPSALPNIKAVSISGNDDTETGNIPVIFDKGYLKDGGQITYTADTTDFIKNCTGGPNMKISAAPASAGLGAQTITVSGVTSCSSNNLEVDATSSEGTTKAEVPLSIDVDTTPQQTKGDASNHEIDAPLTQPGNTVQLSSYFKYAKSFTAASSVGGSTCTTSGEGTANETISSGIGGGAGTNGKCTFEAVGYTGNKTTTITIKFGTGVPAVKTTRNTLRK